MYSQKLKNGKVRFFESARNPLTGEMKTFSVTMEKETNATKKAAEKAAEQEAEENEREEEQLSEELRGEDEE